MSPRTSRYRVAPCANVYCVRPVGRAVRSVLPVEDRSPVLLLHRHVRFISDLSANHFQSQTVRAIVSRCFGDLPIDFFAFYPSVLVLSLYGEQSLDSMGPDKGNRGWSCKPSALPDVRGWSRSVKRILSSFYRRRDRWRRAELTPRATATRAQHTLTVLWKPQASRASFRASSCP